jgi:hypothetical protein
LACRTVQTWDSGKPGQIWALGRAVPGGMPAAFHKKPVGRKLGWRTLVATRRLTSEVRSRHSTSTSRIDDLTNPITFYLFVKLTLDPDNGLGLQFSLPYLPLTKSPLPIYQSSNKKSKLNPQLSWRLAHEYCTVQCYRISCERVRTRGLGIREV